MRLAYATSGSGPPLVKASNWLTHLDYDWASPVWSHWWRALSEDRRLVRYDERGCGLSDWDVDADSFTLDAWVADLETVVDTLGLRALPAARHVAGRPDRRDATPPGTPSGSATSSSTAPAPAPPGPGRTRPSGGSWPRWGS